MPLLAHQRNHPASQTRGTPRLQRTRCFFSRVLSLPAWQKLRYVNDWRYTALIGLRPLLVLPLSPGQTHFKYEVGDFLVLGEEVVNCSDMLFYTALVQYSCQSA